MERQAALRALAKDSAGASETVELDQQRVGRLSRMDAMQLQAMAQATSRRRQVELKRIASAISKIEMGDYGFCNDCGELIPRARLEIDPALTRCVVCAEKGQSC